jgi:hypothetical protein
LTRSEERQIILLDTVVLNGNFVRRIPMQSLLLYLILQNGMDIESMRAYGKSMRAYGKSMRA